MTRYLAIAALAACSVPSTSSETSAITEVLANGSFETGDYSGWTLSESSGQPSFGTWGIASDGETISQGQPVFDFFDQINVAEGSPGLPITYHATDGAFLAFQLQTGPEDHRLFQTVALPSCQPLLQWDMAYSNHNGGGFDPGLQFIAVNVRDPATDAIVATPFKTNPGDPLAVATMTPFVVDLSAFSTQTVRLDFEQQVEQFFFDAAYDHIRVVCKGLGAVPGSIDFGPVPVDVVSPAKTTAITNFADQPLTITSMSIDPPFAVTGAPDLPLTLEPGESTQVSMTFAPTAGGPTTGMLAIASDDPNGATTVALAGLGSVPAPIITVSPAEIDFGPGRVGLVTGTGATAVRIENDGDAPGTIDAVGVTGPFMFVPIALPFTLDPGASVTIYVGFAPIVEGPATGQIVLDCAGQQFSVDLTGTGVQPAAEAFPQTLSFGTQLVGATSDTQLITLSNPGTDTLTVTEIDTGGPFTAPRDLGLQIPPGGSITIDVQFAPTDLGHVNGFIAIDTNAPIGAILIAVDGTGVAPALSVDTASVDFGSERVGVPATRLIGISNPGTSPVAVSSITVGAPFAIAPAGPLTLLPGGHATLTLTFTPTSTGPAADVVHISSSGGDVTVPVAGTGVQPQIAASPSVLAFGDVLVGQSSSSASFDISNPGSDLLVVTSITAPASFVQLTGVGFPLVIPPGGSQTIFVAFTPRHHTSYRNTIAIGSNAGTATVDVSGRGIAPVLVASLDTLDFGPVAIHTTATLDVQLTNTGDAPATVFGAATAGSFEFLLAPMSPTVVQPGTSVTTTVQFTPTDHGMRSARINFATDAPLVSVNATGTGSGARIAVTPASLDLGSANVGDHTPQRSVTVSNTGDVALVISSIVMAGPAALDAAAQASLPLTVAPSTSATVAFTFAPSAVGARAATAMLVTTDPLAPVTFVSLAATGTSPAVAVGPPSLDFGSVNVGSSLVKTFSVTNTGTGPLAITSVDVSGTDVAVESLALPLVLAPSATKLVHVSFAPNSIGTTSATVSVLSDDPATPTIAVPVTGAGTSPSLAMTPSDLDLGAQVVGHPSALRQVHVANTGSGPLAVTSLVFTGPQAAQFALVSPPSVPFAVPVGGEIVLSVRVTPTAAGALAGELELASAAGSASVSLSALGVATGLSVTPATIDFGTTHVPATTAPVTVTLTNLSADPIVLVDAARGGGRPDSFVVSSVAGTLASGASTTATVTYAPTAAGLSAATLTFAATDSTVPPTIVAVAGKAVSTFVVVDHDALDFGPIEVGEHSGAKSITVTNVTTQPLTIANIVAADPQLAVDGVPTAPIAPGQSATFTVAFSPASEGSFVSSVSVTLAGATSPELVVAVHGEGLAPSDTASCNASGATAGWLVVVVVLGLRRRRKFVEP